MSHILNSSGSPFDSASVPGDRIPGITSGQQTCSVAGAASLSDATVPVKKPRHSTAALFYGFPATLIAEVLCVTPQTAYQFKAGTRRPGPTAWRLWNLYHAGRILDDQWDGWSSRNGAIFDPEGHRTTQAQLRAYAFVWQLARELARNDPIASEALDQYARMASERLTRQRRKRSAGASVATADDSLTSRCENEPEDSLTHDSVAVADTARLRAMHSR